ncbi:MAG: pyruvate dehydrogenase complex dihydrolipoamide acetyltransferase [Balneolales bacterium]
MAIVIDMPKLSDTMEEGVIAKWNVKEGDEVKTGDIIAEVETDKATMEVEAFDPGTILKIFVKEGDAVPLGGKMAIIGKPDEDISDLLGDDDGKAEPVSKEEKEPVEKETLESEAEAEETKGKPDEFDPEAEDAKADKVSDKKSTSDDGKIKISPLAKKMAKDKGIELSNIQGSGPQGRIIKKDIEEYKETPGAQQQAAMKRPEKDEDVQVSQMRKVIAKRLAESKFGSPHFYETIDIDMKKAIEAREGMNASGEVKISFNDFVVKACAMALRKHPKVNSSWMGDVMRRHAGIHVAVAVAVDEGLLTPVIRDTDLKGFVQISAETKELAGKARDKKLQPEEWEGSTFTVSNLGMFGIEEFTAIINPPNACILAVGAIRDVPVIEDGQVVPGKRMKVTLSSDHRIVDGATSAQFLKTVRELLENPVNMLL